MKIKLSITAIALLLSFYVAKAQVTIGSDQPPRAGSLLDLEQDGTPEKGLGLPRVALTSLSILKIGNNESQKQNYVGTMVYNTTNNGNIKEGIYCWTGDRWMQAIVVNSKGANGSMLKSNGDGTYGWSAVTIPDYEFHKPTNIRGFKEKNSTKNEFKYNEIVYYLDRDGVWLPNTNAFNNRMYVYTDTINIQTDASTKKFMLLGTTITTLKATEAPSLYPSLNTWENLIIEAIITKINPNGTLGTPKTLKRHATTENVYAYGPTTTYFDLFSIISLNDVDSTISKGDYQIKIKVTVRETSLGRDNAFYKGSTYTFYTIGIRDMNLVVFEHE